MGVTYEFWISAKNIVGFGEQGVETIRTPDGSELFNLTKFTQSQKIVRLVLGALCQNSGIQ